MTRLSVLEQSNATRPLKALVSEYLFKISTLMTRTPRRHRMNINGDAAPEGIERRRFSQVGQKFARGAVLE